MAKMQADLETVRIAEFYSSHPLLRNMPIPHFRLPSVELDVPIVIQSTEEEPTDKPPRGAPILDNMRKAFDKLLNKFLRDSHLILTSAQEKKLKASLDEKQYSLIQPREVAVDINRVASEFAKVASLSLTESMNKTDPKQFEKMELALKERAKVDFMNLREPPPRLHVLVTTAEIREAGPDEVITHLHLKLNEEAFEWTVIDSNGEKKERLVIE